MAMKQAGSGRAGSRAKAMIGIVRMTVIGLFFAAATVVLLLWLAGYFEHKIDTTATAGQGQGVVLPSVGDRRRVEAEVISLPRIETAVGTVQAVHELTVASKILARVQTIHVSAGESVQQGEILATLDDEDLQARVEQATANVQAAQSRRDQATREHERIKEIFASGAANELELNRARTAADAALAELVRAQQAEREARTILTYATIRSPITGTVVEKLVEAGDTVVPGQPMITLYDPSRMQLVASVRESLTQRLNVGDPVDVQIESLGHECTGMISEIVPQAQEQSRSFLVKVTGPCPPGVYSGMFGRLLIPLDDEQILVIPSAAVRRVGQIELVDVVVDDHVVRRAVRTGRSVEGDQVEILSGLRAGEVVALPAGRQEGPGV